MTIKLLIKYQKYKLIQNNKKEYMPVLLLNIVDKKYLS
jgi:hypothetical protein